MRTCPTCVAGVWLLAGLALGGAGKDEPAASREPATDALAMTPAVACRSIEGYEQFEPLPGGALTSDEKLLVYYRPLRYQVESKGGKSHIHLTQDGQIRRHGEKAVLLRKAKLLDYEFKGGGVVAPIYLRNTIALKGLKPGEYDLDIILHDQLAGGPPATQSLRFKVVPAVLPKPEADPEEPEAKPAPPARSKTKAKRGGR